MVFTEVHIEVGGDNDDARAVAAGRIIEALAGAEASTITLIGSRY